MRTWQSRAWRLVAAGAAIGFVAMDIVSSIIFSPPTPIRVAFLAGALWIGIPAGAVGGAFVSLYVSPKAEEWDRRRRGIVIEEDYQVLHDNAGPLDKRPNEDELT